MEDRKLFDKALAQYSTSEKGFLKAEEALAKANKKKTEDMNVLVASIGGLIMSECSSEFVAELSKEVPKEARRFMVNPSQVSTYLDYLAKVIFHSLSSQEVPVDFRYFLLPGMYDEGRAFFKQFSENFAKLETALGIIKCEEYPNAEGGYAIWFFKPTL